MNFANKRGFLLKFQTVLPFIFDNKYAVGPQNETFKFKDDTDHHCYRGIIP